MDTQPELQLVHYARQLRATLPTLNLSDLRLVQSGQNSDVLFIGDDLIARFPRYDHGIQQLEWEADLLRALGPRLPLAIPDPLVVRVGEPGAAFMVYHAVPGIPLSRNAFSGSTDEDTLKSAASDLATFLSSLHAIPAEEVPVRADACAHWIHPWRDLYERIQRVLFPSMSRTACAWTEQHFEAFLSHADNTVIAPTLVHGDFGAANILVDAQTRRVTGVIDFSSAHLDDPALDLAAVSTLGRGFLHRFTPIYPDLASALPRVRFYRGTFALQEALFGAENNDQRALAAGLADVPPSSDMVEV